VDPRRIFGHVFGVESMIAAAVFAAVCAAIIVAFALSRRRRRHDRPASQAEEHPRLEFAYAAAIAAIAGFVVWLSFHTTSQENASAQPSAQPSAAKIQVTGFQWCWRFTYPSTNKSVTGTCDGGSLPTMVVPVGQPITLQISSTDVIHSWWVPELRYKLDAFPDHVNTVTLIVDRTGRWAGRCAEFCGHWHTYMDFYLKAVPPKQFQQWLRAR
jgi:cytochrome c oxidase subunit 2